MKASLIRVAIFFIGIDCLAMGLVYSLRPTYATLPPIQFRCELRVESHLLSNPDVHGLFAREVCPGGREFQIVLNGDGMVGWKER